MNKNFTQVIEFIKTRMKECVITLAGISFTLFGANNIQANKLVFETAPRIERVAQEKVKPDYSSDIEVVLSSNSLSTKDKMINAFENFKQYSKQDTQCLEQPFSEIVEEFKSINVDKVSVDGDPVKGRLNVAFRLPDGIILSINKKIGLHKGGIVGFNIISNKQLLLSDVISLSRLREYISNVQNKSV